MTHYINMTCPSCGAVLNVDGNRTEYYCQYCGTKIALVDEEKERHREEKEKQKKKDEMDAASLHLRALELNNEQVKMNNWVKITKLIMTTILSIVGVFAECYIFVGEAFCHEVVLTKLIVSFGCLSILTAGIVMLNRDMHE